MAGLFAHAWIANLVLKELSKRDFISDYENIDDYFFGSIAPDIRYIKNSARDVTHRPLGSHSIFEALKISSMSMPFMAGYETHLIVDDTWSNDNKLMGKSIYEYYGVDVNNPAQKFSLYLAVDDYFQGKADWLFPITAAGNVLRANDISILLELGFGQRDIGLYRVLSAGYIHEPGLDTLNAFGIVPNFDERRLKQIADQTPPLTSFLKDFSRISVEKCIESLEAYL